MKILFVDDDQFGVKSYREHLRMHLQCEVVKARTVGDAQELLHDDAGFDLIILDMHLPLGAAENIGGDDNGDEMQNGRVLLRSVSKTWPSIPVIVFSITNSDNLRDKYKQVKSVLRKQNTLPEDLTKIIRERD